MRSTAYCRQENAIFHILFTKPGRSLLVVPCRCGEGGNNAISSMRMNCCSLHFRDNGDNRRLCWLHARHGTLIATTPMDIREMCLPSLPAITVIFYLLHLFTRRRRSHFSRRLEEDESGERGCLVCVLQGRMEFLLCVH